MKSQIGHMIELYNKQIVSTIYNKLWRILKVFLTYRATSNKYRANIKILSKITDSKILAQKSHRRPYDKNMATKFTSNKRKTLWCNMVESWRLNIKKLNQIKLKIPLLPETR